MTEPLTSGMFQITGVVKSIEQRTSKNGKEFTELFIAWTPPARPNFTQDEQVTTVVAFGKLATQALDIADGSLVWVWGELGSSIRATDKGTFASIRLTAQNVEVLAEADPNTAEAQRDAAEEHNTPAPNAAPARQFPRSQGAQEPEAVADDLPF